MFAGQVLLFRGVASSSTPRPGRRAVLLLQRAGVSSTSSTVSLSVLPKVLPDAVGLGAVAVGAAVSAMTPPCFWARKRATGSGFLPTSGPGSTETKGSQCWTWPRALALDVQSRLLGCSPKVDIVPELSQSSFRTLFAAKARRSLPASFHVSGTATLSGSPANFPPRKAIQTTSSLRRSSPGEAGGEPSLSSLFLDDRHGSSSCALDPFVSSLDGFPRPTENSRHKARSVPDRLRLGLVAESLSLTGLFNHLQAHHANPTSPDRRHQLLSRDMLEVGSTYDLNQTIHIASMNGGEVSGRFP